MFKSFRLWVVYPIFLMVVLMVAAYAARETKKWWDSMPNYVSPTEVLQSLDLKEDVSDFKPSGELASAFLLDSKYTDVQRQNLLKKIAGKLIIWEVSVYEVSRLGNKKYRIQTQSGDDSFWLTCPNVETFVELTAKDDEQVKFIEEIKTDQVIRIKGILTGGSIFRNLVIMPAILWYPGSNAKSSESNFNIEYAKKSIQLQCD